MCIEECTWNGTARHSWINIKLFSLSNAEARISEVMEPFGDIDTMAGIFLSRNSQRVEPGNAFTEPI